MQRKLYIFSLLLFSTFNFIFSQDLKQNLLVYYPLNGTAEDLSGNGFNGFYSAIPEINRFGDEEKASSFNGMDTYIDLPFNFELKPNFPFAIAFWVYFEENVSFVLTTDFANNNHSGAWFNRLGNKAFSYSIGNAEGNTSPNERSSFNSNFVMEDKVWYHVAVNWTSAEESELFIDAVSRNIDHSGFATEIGYTNNPGSLGRKDPNIVDTTYFFEGRLDDFYMWDRLLSQDDVDSLYFNGGLSSPVEIPNSDIQINLSPNPINDLMIIDHPENYTLGAYQIFNSIGKIVRSGTDLTENQIDLSTIPSGTYFISLHLKKPSGERIIANQKFSKI